MKSRQIFFCTMDDIFIFFTCIGCIVNPEAFLFGGGMAAAGDILLEPIGRVYNAKVFPPLRGTPILQATLGNEAGITGAVRLVQIEQQA